MTNLMKKHLLAIMFSTPCLLIADIVSYYPTRNSEGRVYALLCLISGIFAFFCFLSIIFTSLYNTLFKKKQTKIHLRNLIITLFISIIMFILGIALLVTRGTTWIKHHPIHPPPDPFQDFNPIDNMHAN